MKYIHCLHISYLHNILFHLMSFLPFGNCNQKRCQAFLTPWWRGIVILMTMDYLITVETGGGNPLSLSSCTLTTWGPVFRVDSVREPLTAGWPQRRNVNDNLSLQLTLGQPDAHILSPFHSINSKSYRSCYFGLPTDWCTLYSDE
jgi:hypothetical protein